MEKESVEFKTMEEAEIWAKTKYEKLFVAKPKKLVDQFPVKENPKFWVYPKRKPREDMAYDETNALHTEFVSLISKYGAVLLHVIQVG